MWEASEDRCSIYMGGSATTIIKEIHPGETGPKTRQDLAPNLVGWLSRWLLLASGALPRWTAARKAELRKTLCSNTFLRPLLRRWKTSLRQRLRKSVM